MVRRDLEGLRPAAVEAVLAVAIGREIARTDDPARLLAAVLDVVSMKERLVDDDRLPGWRLVEDDERGRRIHVTSADVLEGAPSRRAPRTHRKTLRRARRAAAVRSPRGAATPARRAPRASPEGLRHRTLFAAG